MDVLVLLAGFAVPWTLGAALLTMLPGDRGAGSGAWLAGCAWFVGAFLLTVWIRLIDLAGFSLGITAIGLPLLAATGVLLGFALWRRTLRVSALRPSLQLLVGRELHGWLRIAWLALLAWLAVRFALLLTEVLLRPLYPWDAWTQWGTKAKVWFELRSMAPFVGAGQWLQAPDATVYFDAAPHYPATVPLLQLWSALLIGRWDDALVNLPWWLTGVALGLALYGALVQRGFAPLPALTGTWLVLSLPILNVHVALAGYADLAMASYFTLAVLATQRWTQTRRWPDAALALLLAAACVTVKNPGMVWVLVLLPGLVVALAPRYGLRIVGMGFALAVLLVILLARTQIRLLGYTLQEEFRMPWSSLADAYLLFGNWNLLWYGVLAMVLLGWRQVLAREIAPLTVTVAGGVLFLLFGFAFTNAGAWVEDQSTVNRATLHLAPLALIWMMLVVRTWLAKSAPAIATSSAG